MNWSTAVEHYADEIEGVARFSPELRMNSHAPACPSAIEPKHCPCNWPAKRAREDLMRLAWELKQVARRGTPSFGV